MLKNTLVPVWNKPVFNPDSPTESSVPAKNGSLSANALFAEPTWDKEESYNFEYERDDGSTISATVNKGELEFINCTYDEIGDLWVLSGTSDTKYFSGEDSSVSEWRYCYVLKNVSTGDEYNVTTGEYNATAYYYEKMLQDFAVATVEGQKYLLCITDTGDGNNIKSFKIEDEGGDLENGTQHFTFGQRQISAIYVKDKKIYIAITVTNSGETGDNITANIYTGTISLNETNNSLNIKLIKDSDDNPKALLSLNITDFTNTDISNTFDSPAFAISDMYINEDKTKLYVTAGCVNYNGNSWNNNQDHGFYHSFGGLFVYDIIENSEIPVISNDNIPGKYGIYEGNDENNPFLTTGGEGILELEENIMQAVANDSQYFAGPRYIIPAGKDLLIVDSGFYGVYSGEKKRLIYCEKRNRIFTYNIIENELLITKVDDSISFDYDYLVNSGGIE